MKTIKLLFCFSFFIFSFSICEGQSWMWAKAGTPITPLGGGEVCYNATDAHGNTYIVGVFRSEMVFGTDTLKGDSDIYFNIFLVKYNALGNVLWAKAAKERGAVNNGGPVAVTIDGFGNVYITGFFSVSITFGLYTLTEPGSIWDMFIAKYDSNGNVIWAKQATDASATSGGGGWSIATDPSNNIYVTGFFSDTVSFDTYTLKEAKTRSPWWESWDLFLVKYDTAGNVLWAKQSNHLNNLSIGYGASVAVDNFYNIYLTGSCGDTLIIENDTLKQKNSENVFLMKFDTSGNIIWAEQPTEASSTSYGVGSSLSVDGSGGIFMTGYLRDTLVFDADTLKEKVLYGGDAFLCKYDVSGAVIWAKAGVILDSSSYYGLSVACDTVKHGGGYLLVTTDGYAPPPYKLAFGNDTFNLNTGYGATILLRFDSTGKTICGSIYGDGDEPYGTVSVDRSGEYVCMSQNFDTSLVFGPDSLVKWHSSWNDAPFIARWQPCDYTTEDIKKIPFQGYSTSLFPNPNNGIFTIQPSLASNRLTVEIYNMMGEKVFSMYNAQLSIVNSPLSIDLGSQPSGIYLYRIMDENGKLIGSGKFVVAH